MSKPLRGALGLPISLAALLAIGGCGEGTTDVQSAGASPVVPAPGPGPGPGGGGPGGRSSPIREIMGKVARGPNSLTSVIGNELNADNPPWETIQPQAKEFARLAGDMGKYDPPKGSKESWSKLTLAYADTAGALDKAAQAKDRDAAKAAHTKLKNSCNECHKEHRMMRGGPMGGMGMPPGFGPPGGGGGPPPPPGSPPPQ